MCSKQKGEGSYLLATEHRLHNRFKTHFRAVYLSLTKLGAEATTSKVPCRYTDAFKNI